MSMEQLIELQGIDTKLRDLNDLLGDLPSKVKGLNEQEDSIKNSQLNYFKKISSLNLKTPKLIGFGISNSETYNNAIMYSKGAIIGSAFIEFIKNEGVNNIEKFIDKIKAK